MINLTYLRAQTGRLQHPKCAIFMIDIPEILHILDLLELAHMVLDEVEPGLLDNIHFPYHSERNCHHYIIILEMGHGHSFKARATNVCNL